MRGYHTADQQQPGRTRRSIQTCSESHLSYLDVSVLSAHGDSDRVFVLGPSHHAYLDGCALSQCADYATPLGNLSLDQATIAELKETGKFTDMSSGTDEDEHSIEMHLPYIRKAFEK